VGVRPGIGGISRGGSSTGLLWGDESEGDHDRFRPELLPSSRFLDIEHSATLAVGEDAPEVAPIGEDAGRVDVAGAEGEAAWRRRLSPRHRDAVQEFFSSGEER